MKKKLIVLFDYGNEKNLQYTAESPVHSAAQMECEALYPGCVVQGFKEVPVLEIVKPFECPHCGRVYTEGWRECTSDDCPGNE